MDDLAIFWSGMALKSKVWVEIRLNHFATKAINHIASGLLIAKHANELYQMERMRIFSKTSTIAEAQEQEQER